MRRTVLPSLFLLPLLAHAQAKTSTEPQPSNSSPVLLAELNRPSAPSVPAASLSAVAMASHPAIRESVQTRMVDDLMASAMRHPGALEFALKGSAATEFSAPKLTRAVEIEVSDEDIAEKPAVSSVVVRAIVDENGVPRNVAVTQSAGSVIDHKAVAAVTQYRFKPATLDNKATWATVSITIQIQKP